MFAYIIWGIIILAIILSFRRLASGLIVTIVLIAAVFFVVFIIDRASDVPIRDYIPMEWFDETMDEPERKAKEVGEGFTEAGKDVADTVDEKGKELDIKYGTGDSKEWVDVEEEDNEEENNDESKDEEKEDGDKEDGDKEDKDKKEGSKENKDKKDKKEGSKQDKEGKKKNKKKEDETTKKLKSDEGLYVEYEDVEDIIKEYLGDINEEDKDIMKTMSGIYKTKFEGEDIVVWNNKGTGNEGLYVKYK